VVLPHKVMAFTAPLLRPTLMTFAKLFRFLANANPNRVILSEVTHAFRESRSRRTPKNSICRNPSIVSTPNIHRI
jgi:hypothetical protein